MESNCYRVQSAVPIFFQLFFQIINRIFFMATVLVSAFTLLSAFSLVFGPSQAYASDLIQDEYRLKDDRKEMDEIRKNLPPELKAENDELALLLKMTGETQDKPPTKVREKFNSLASKKRQLFQKDMDRKRSDYVRNEKKQREQFQKENENFKKEFMKKKASSDQKREFFSDNEDRRRTFYQELREKRDEFETDMRDSRKNFDDYIREKTSEFNQEIRAYEKRYTDQLRKKESDRRTVISTQTQAPGDIEKEFREVDKKPAKLLGTDDSPGE